MRRVSSVVALACGLCCFDASPAEAQRDGEFQIWNALLGTANTSPRTPRLKLWLDVHARRGDDDVVAIFRPGAGVQVSSWLTFWLGYAWVPVWTEAPDPPRNEHRFWQQVTLSFSNEHGLSFQSRSRFEFRFVEDGDDIGFRFRQFVRLNYQPSTRSPLGIALWDELFLAFNDTDWGQQGGFDQNRLFVGPFFKATDWARFEAGYLFVALDRGGIRYQHVLAVNLFLTLGP